MKNKNTNNKNPYRTTGCGKIEAPNKIGKFEPKSSKITGKGDLRGGRK